MVERRTSVRRSLSTRSSIYLIHRQFTPKPSFAPSVPSMNAHTYPGKGLSLSQLFFALNEELKRVASSSAYVAIPDSPKNGLLTSPQLHHGCNFSTRPGCLGRAGNYSRMEELPRSRQSHPVGNPLPHPHLPFFPEGSFLRRFCVSSLA